jgi:hypothetical protein
VTRAVLFPDPEPAREWMSRELSRPEYQASLLERLGHWIEDLLATLRQASGHIGSLNPVAATVLLVVLAALLALVLSRLRRNPAASDQSGRVFAAHRLAASDHRRLAQEALERGAWDEAVVEGVRALAAGLSERGLVPEQPDVTVHELSENAAALYPSLGSRLRTAARTFDETRYGDRPAGEQEARDTVAIDLETSRTQPEATPGRSTAPAVPR